MESLNKRSKGLDSPRCWSIVFAMQREHVDNGCVQRRNYPYASMGYDKKTMCKHFAGYGDDIELANGVRLSAWAQQRLGMNFLKILQKDFGHLTVNEVAAYCFVMNSTIVGDLVGVKDVSAELKIPMSSASYSLLRLEEMRLLEAYPCTKDKRRKWLRLHPAVVKRRLATQDAWQEQRDLLRKVLEEQ